jgi:hypothetical protein
MGCCGVTYEEEIEKQISDYVKTLNESEETKRKLLQEVHEDLKKKKSTDSDYDPSKKDNVEKTVNYYKNYISNKIKGKNNPNDIKVIEKEKEKNIEQKKIKENKIEIQIDKDETIIKKNENNANKKMDKINKSINTEIKEEKEINNKETKDDVKEEIKEENKQVNIQENKDIEKEFNEEKKDNEINWRDLMKDDNNFSQKVPFNFQEISHKLKIASTSPDKLNPYYTISAIYDFTKFFKEISSALSMGFSDITEKCGIIREKFNEYPEATDIQNLLQTEMDLNIHQLNGDNNKKFGHGNDKYKNYKSACRTFLRLLWFFEYLTDVFENVIKDDGSGPIKKILGDSYDKVLAPHHSFLVRKAVGIALTFSSAGNVAKNVDIIFGYKEYNDEARQAISSTVNLMKIIWKGGHDFYKKNDLLNLE